MARRNKAMDEKELIAQLDGQISDAESYAGSELSALRESALRYYDGDMEVDLPSEEGRSSVVSQDLADHIGWLLPSLTRIFLAANEIGIYEPTRPEMVLGPVDERTGQPGKPVDISEDLAKQATDYVNFVLKRDCGGYKVLRDAMFDGLLFGNGIIKHWWDSAPEYETRKYSGQSGDVFALIEGESGVEVVAHSESPDDEAELQADPFTGLPLPPPMLHDFKIKRLKKAGRLRVRAVPGEDFLIEREATALNESDCLFCAHRDTPTRSELLLRGYDREVVEGLTVYTGASNKEGEQAAREPLRSATPSQSDHAAERVEVFECYVKVDFDGDGVAEWRQVVMADGGEGRVILSNEEWGDELPFTDLVPDPVPHRWRGRSMFDDVGQVQKVKTRLERGELDNLYMTLEPNRAIDMSRVRNPDAAVNLKLGEIIQTDGDPNSIIRDLTVPFVAKEAGPIKEYYDKKAERRTGVGERSVGLDKNALQNEQSATATNAMLASSSLKTEDKSRTLAETGMQRFFSCLLKLITGHQDKARTIQLRGKWVEMDPRSWDADMYVTINIGLGAGSPDKDMAALGGVAQKQELVIQVLGPFNPYLNISHLFTTYRKMVETSGIRNPDAYFPEISNDEVAKIRESQESQQKPDPKMMEAQAKLQIEQGKAQSDAQLAQQRAGAELQLTRERNAADIEAQREAGMLKLQLMREETSAKLELAREEAQVKAQLRREEMMLEAELTARANEMAALTNANRPPDTNIYRPGGE